MARRPWPCLLVVGTAGGPVVRRTPHNFRPRRCDGQHKCVSSPRQAGHVARCFTQPSTFACSNRCGCNQAIRAGQIEYLVKWTEEHDLQRRCISPACQGARGRLHAHVSLLAGPLPARGVSFLAYRCAVVGGTLCRTRAPRV